MPDHGVRFPSYTAGPLSTGIMSLSPYGWVGTPRYRGDDLLPSNPTYYPASQFLYERIDWGEFKQQLKDLNWSQTLGDAPHMSNPPFLGAGQMMGPNGVPEWMRLPNNGGVAR